MSLHFPLPKIRTFRFSLHSSRLTLHTSRLSFHGEVTMVALKFAMSSHFPLPKNIFALRLCSPSFEWHEPRDEWSKTQGKWSNPAQSYFVLPIEKPPLDLSFWSFSTLLHHGIEEVERHLLWKFYNKLRRKSWSNVPPKVLACIGFLYKVVHQIGRLWKFNRSREIEFNFLTARTISMKFGTLVQHALGYKTLPQIF